MLAGNQAAAQPAPRNDAAVQKILQLHDSLTHFHEYYFDLSLKEPANKGARTLAYQLDSINNVVRKYLLGTANSKSLKEAIVHLRTEGGRFTSPMARRLNRALRQAAQVGQALPIRVEPPFTEADLQRRIAPPPAQTPPRDSATADSLLARMNNLADKPADAARPHSAAGAASLTVYALFAVAGLLALAALLYARVLHKRTQELNTTLALQNNRFDAVERSFRRLTAELEQAQADQPFEILVNDFNKKLDELQQRLGGILQRLETRATHAENLLNGLQDQSSVWASGSQKMADLLADVHTLKELTLEMEERLKAAEGRLATTATPAAPAIAATPGPLRVLLPPLRELAHRSSSQHLRELALRLTAVLERSNADEADAIFTPQQVGNIVQLAYAAGKNENLLAAYQQLVHAAKQLDYTVEDAMTGRMALSEHYARNVGYPDYKKAGNIPNPLEPAYERVLADIDKSGLAYTAIKNTVLYVLSPTVVRQEAGVRWVAQKGTYIVQS